MVSRIFITVLIVLLAAATGWPSEQAPPVEPAVIEAEGYACMGYDKSRRQTEQEALANAKRNAAEKAKTHIESETSIRDFEMEKDLISSYANATITILVTLETGWYRDPTSGDCYKVRIKAEVTPEAPQGRKGLSPQEQSRAELEQKGVSYSGDNFINAVRDERTDIVELFIKAGIDVNSRHSEDPSRTTALIWSVHKGNTGLVQMLTQAGADPDISDKYRNMPLPDASERGHADIAKILIESGADINAYGGSPLILSSRKGHIGIVRMLLDHGADVKGTAGDKALIDASEAGHTDIARMLIESGADVNARDGSGYTPLIRAAQTGRVETVKLLIDRGADINAADSFSFTALMRAAQYDRYEMAELLIGKGAELNMQSKRGETALIWAIRERNESIARLLIESGADTGISDSSGKSALYWAKNKKLERIVELLNKSGG